MIHKKKPGALRRALLFLDVKITLEVLWLTNQYSVFVVGF